MKLKIGKNIKRLRKMLGITQENIAELLNVSCSAVSKWESCDTYPDITMILPLAHFFKVSVDELMGYDAACIEAEIKKIISEYRQLQASGKFCEATVLISNARKQYPNDYKIMNCYMWDIAGGYADNNPEVLKENTTEFMQICDCIINGCTDEKIRLDALTMKAKLAYASSKTFESLEIISQLPDWYHTRGQKTEQLYPKDTPEFRYWILKNQYELAGFTANKIIKAIWFKNSITLDERLLQCEAICDMFTSIRKQSRECVFIVFEHAALAELSGKLTFFEGKIQDIIRIENKALIALRELSVAAKKDKVLRGILLNTYETENVLEWKVDWLKTAPLEPIAKLRKNKEFMVMLEKFNDK